MFRVVFCSSTLSIWRKVTRTKIIATTLRSLETNRTLVPLLPRTDESPSVLLHGDAEGGRRLVRDYELKAKARTLPRSARAGAGLRIVDAGSC
jgi:hypothetical protein